MTSFTHEIKVQGNVETDQDVTLSSEMGGLLIAIPVKEGQTVRKGQVLARIDASVMASNYAELASQLEYAEYMLSKQEELNKRGLGSEMELETARNQVKSLKASMNSLNTQRGKSVIKAPFTGVIDKVFARQGQIAGPSTPVIRLVNNEDIDIVANISEKHFSKVQIGTPVLVRFPNYSDTTVMLKVSNIGNYIEPTNRTFRVMASVENNSIFLPNMLAELSITDLEVDKGLVISSQSILKDQNSDDYVFVVRDDIVHKVIVRVIERSNGRALIEQSSKGVKAGDTIVVAGARGVIDKDKVKVQKTDK